MTKYPALLRRGFVLPSRLKNQYDGAGTGRRAKNWKVASGSPNKTLIQNLKSLRDRSQTAFDNDPYAFGGVDRLVANTIGTGIVPHPQLTDDTKRKELIQLYSDWTDEADFDGVYDFYGLQALAAYSFFVKGECFLRLMPDVNDDNDSVPLQIQALAPEMIPITKNEDLKGGGQIKAGIEFDKSGKRVAYHVCKKHPGDGGSDSETVRIDASEILHIFEPMIIGQVRGTPTMTKILLRLKSLDELDDAVLYRQEVSNLFAGFIRKPGADPNANPDTGQPDNIMTGFDALVSMEPGTMQELYPGEDVTFSDPPDAGTSYAPFMKQQHQGLAVGFGVPYELLTGDVGSIGDRALRVIINEFRRRVEMRQFGVFVFQMCRPIWRRFLDMAVLANVIELPDYENRKREYRRVRWVPQGWAYIHPVQDVTAKQLEVRSGFTSRSEVVLSRGFSSEDIDEENKSDNTRADELGLRYDSDGRKSRLSPASDSTIVADGEELTTEGDEE
jgi:phage portal protein, lambda family